MDQAYLPPKLELDGTYNRLIELLYAVFKHDFLLSRPFFERLPVVVDDRKINSDKEEGFWHIVTRDEAEGRLLDYKRAKRLPWLRPLIECPPDPDILRWNERSLDQRRGKMVRKHFIWYERGKYLIILKENPHNYFLVTAFYVTGERNYNYFMKKYLAQKKGTGY